MKTIKHEDQVYVLKTDMEEAIKDRISKMTARATSAEERISDMQTQIEASSKQGATVEQLSRTIEELKGNLASKDNRFERYRSISQFGLVDPEMIEAIEWTYDRKMANVAEVDRQDLGAWLELQIQNPDTAPSLLRPHLTKIQNPTSSRPQADPSATGYSNPTQPKAQAPNVNQGAIVPPNTGNLIAQGIKDAEFYRANRDAIKQQFQALTGGKR